MIKPTLWDGEDLEGEWEVTLKLDGVRALIKDGIALSRSNKPLYNLEHLPNGDYEIYCGTWEDSVSAVRTKDGSYVDHSNAYSLDPIDETLVYTTVENPTADFITLLLDEVLSLLENYEGLVLRQGDTWLKVKPKDNYDVEVLATTQSKNEGRIGSLVTSMGNVPIQEIALKELWYTKPEKIVGMLIEVESDPLTKNGKFRFPRFKRVRWDK